VSLPQNAILTLVSGFFGRLRFPQLFALMGVLFLLDLLVPDLIPFVDEMMLGMATLLFGSWKRDRASKGKPPMTDREDAASPGGPSTGPVIDVEPEDGTGSGQRDR